MTRLMVFSVSEAADRNSAYFESYQNWCEIVYRVECDVLHAIYPTDTSHT